MLIPIMKRAKANVEKWGSQDFETLGLAVCEEAGELAQAILKHRHESGSLDRIYDEAVDLAALCIQVIWQYEAIAIPATPPRDGEGERTK